MSGKPSTVLRHEIWTDGSCFGRLVPPVRAHGHEVVGAQCTLDSAQSDVSAVLTASRNLAASLQGTIATV
jgi:hypothetical protein